MHIVIYQRQYRWYKYQRTSVFAGLTVILANEASIFLKELFEHNQRFF